VFIRINQKQYPLTIECVYSKKEVSALWSVAELLMDIAFYFTDLKIKKPYNKVRLKILKCFV